MRWRSEDATIRLVLAWKPEGKMSRDSPWMRWIDVVERDPVDLVARN